MPLGEMFFVPSRLNRTPFIITSLPPMPFDTPVPLVPSRERMEAVRRHLDRLRFPWPANNPFTDSEMQYLESMYDHYFEDIDEPEVSIQLGDSDGAALELLMLADLRFSDDPLVCWSLIASTMKKFGTVEPQAAYVARKQTWLFRLARQYAGKYKKLGVDLENFTSLGAVPESKAISIKQNTGWDIRGMVRNAKQAEWIANGGASYLQTTPATASKQPVDPEPARSEPSKSEPAKSEPSESEPSKSEPSESEPSKSEPSKSEPSKSEPSKSEPSKSEPSKSEPSKSEPTDKVPKKMSRQEIRMEARKKAKQQGKLK